MKRRVNGILLDLSEFFSSADFALIFTCVKKDAEMMRLRNEVTALTDDKLRLNQEQEVLVQVKIFLNT